MERGRGRGEGKTHHVQLAFTSAFLRAEATLYVKDDEKRRGRDSRLTRGRRATAEQTVMRRRRHAAPFFFSRRDTQTNLNCSSLFPSHCLPPPLRRPLAGENNFLTKTILGQHQTPTGGLSHLEVASRPLMHNFILRRIFKEISKLPVVHLGRCNYCRYTLSFKSLRSQTYFPIELHYNQLHEIISWNALRASLVKQISVKLCRTHMGRL